MAVGCRKEIELAVAHWRVSDGLLRELQLDCVPVCLPPPPRPPVLPAGVCQPAQPHGACA